MRRCIGLASLLIFLTGCTVGPKYKRPAIQSPDKYYTETNPQSNSIADLAWWELFKDPVLQGLIHEALKNNYDVATAAARVEEARAQAGIAQSFYYPQIGYGAGITGQRSPVIPNHTYYSYNFNLAWEIDLWGRIRKLNEQQRAIFFATEEARRVAESGFRSRASLL